jgi:RNA polymerase sigma-70 factor (ECF subfamily)
MTERQLEGLRAPLMVQALNWLKNREDAEDAVQLALTRVWCKRADIEGNPINYAIRTLQRGIMDQQRKTRRRPTVVLESQCEDAEAVIQDCMPDPDFEQCALAKLIAASDRSDILNAVRELPEVQRSVVALVWFEDRTYEEAAKILGLHMGTVRSRIWRAKQALRPILEHEGALN